MNNENDNKNVLTKNLDILNELLFKKNQKIADNKYNKVEYEKVKDMEMVNLLKVLNNCLQNISERLNKLENNK